MSQRFHYATGIATVNETVTYTDGPWQFAEVRFAVAATSTAASVKTTIDSYQGEAYDIRLDAHQMIADSEYLYQPTRPINLGPNDAIDVTMNCATRWALTIAWNNDK